MAKEHINLLPPKRRQHLRTGVLLLTSTKIMNMFLLILGLLTFVAVVIGILLWVFALQTESTAGVDLPDKINRYRDSYSFVSSNNSILESAQSVEDNKVNWTIYINDVLNIAPAGIEISRLNGLIEDDELTLLVSGVANTRSSVVIFEEKLNQLDWIARLQAPRANLLQPKNAPYSFGILIDQSKR